MASLADTRLSQSQTDTLTLSEFIQVFAAHTSMKKLVMVVFVIAFLKAGGVTNQQAFAPLFCIGMYYMIRGLWLAVKLRAANSHLL